MKTLYESILDDEENVLDNQDAIIEEWLKKYSLCFGGYKVHDGIIDVDGDIMIKKFNLDDIPSKLKFGNINGELTIMRNDITDLTFLGSPKYCKAFRVENCPNLISLEGAPETIKGHMRLLGCENLKDLNYCPVPLDFNMSVLSMEGNGVVDFTTLPKKCIYKTICVRLSKKFKSIKGCPEGTISFNANYSGIKSLEDAPKSLVKLAIMGCKSLRKLGGIDILCENAPDGEIIVDEWMVHNNDKVKDWTIDVYNSKVIKNMG